MKEQMAVGWDRRTRGEPAMQAQAQLQPLHLPLRAGRQSMRAAHSHYLVSSLVQCGEIFSCIEHLIGTECVWGALTSHCWVYIIGFFLLFLSFLLPSYFQFLPSNFACNVASPNLVCSSSPRYSQLFLLSWLSLRDENLRRVVQRCTKLKDIF